MSIRKREWKTGIAWQVDYRDGQGKRRARQFDTKKEAVAWAARAAVEIQDGIHTADSTSITVAQAGEVWIEACRNDGLERSTLRQYRNHLDLHINPLIGQTKLSRLTTPMVKEFRDRLANARSAIIATKVLTSLGSIIGEMQERGLVAQNVARAARRRARGRAATRHKLPLKIGETIPSKQDVRALLEAAEGRWRPLFVTAAFTGLRASELRGLAWDNVSFEDRVIRVECRADEFGQIGSVKSESGRRRVTMPPVVLNTLREWKLACPKGPLGLVFPNTLGTVDNLSNIHRLGYAPTSIRAGLETSRIVNGRTVMRKKYTFHALRHFYASWLIDQDFPPKKIQSLMGHASITMTFDIYGHLFPTDDDDFARLAAGERSVIG